MISILARSVIPVLKPCLNNVSQTLFLSAAFEAVDEPAKAGNDARGFFFLSSHHSLLSVCNPSHQVGKGLAVVLLVVVEDQGWRFCTQSSSSGDVIADVHGVAQSRYLVTQEH